MKQRPRKTVIHVNRTILAQNAKTGEDKPTITVKTYKSNEYAHEVEILGPSKVVYDPARQLSCGARVWIETQAPVNLIHRG